MLSWNGCLYSIIRGADGSWREGSQAVGLDGVARCLIV